MKRHRHLLVGATTALFACVALGSSPTMATPCTNLRSLQLQHTVINSADDNTTGTFVPPGSTPITGLPAFTTIRGGAYFFVPGIRALRFLAAGAGKPH